MQKLIDKLNRLVGQGSLNFDSLGDFVFDWPWSDLNYHNLLPEPVQQGYSRNILQLDPVEVVLLRWPPGQASAIHLHSGFYGYVVVLEGNLDNVTYSWKHQTVKHLQTQKGYTGAILPEPNGVIHELRNPSPDHEAITLHIYYPPLVNFDGMYIFDIEQRKLGILNVQAKTSSWSEPKSSFKSLKEKAFMLERFEGNDHNTHEVVPVLPKLEKEVIYATINDYYAEQALHYDQADVSKAKRQQFIAAINQIVAEEISTKPAMENLLGLACGTARRLNKIRELSGVEYSISGVEPSKEMSMIARSRGVETHNCRWLHVDLGNECYDVATMLYAFGHFASRSQRIEALKKVYDHLKPNGWLFLDVFNIEDQHEWGPEIKQSYQDLRLGRQGYELGDVFYRKIGRESIAFLHYFSREEIEGLLREVGFDIEWIKVVGYAQKTGRLLENDLDGVLFIKAIKGN